MEYVELQKGGDLSTTTLAPHLQDESLAGSVQERIASIIDDLIRRLPNPQRLTSDGRRGIIARYTAVLEGNFIYWMTATYLALQSEEARSIVTENLHEEVRDSHPVMLRRFAVAANAFPTDIDALAVHIPLTQMRLFLGKLRGVQSLVTMAFFECFIQRFMIFLAELAGAQGSAERVYTDVHGVCDIEHSQELFRAVALERLLHPGSAEAGLFEGVDLLCTLIHSIVDGPGREAL
jgi:hypothetical protein